jgi:hypothetical protein
MNIKGTIKSWIAGAVDRTLVPLVRHTYYKAGIFQPHQPKSLDEILAERASISAADYVESRMPYAIKFYDRMELLEFALSKVSLDGMFAEFGVFQGESINFIAGKASHGAKIYGFDSFEGLQEDWRGAYLTKGAFSLEGRLPRVANNVELVKGWFNETLPPFLSRHPGPFAFIHVDCDTYEATRTLFAAVGGRVLAGTVIVFDEYFGFVGWRVSEWKAWQEFVAEHGIRYEYIGYANVRAAVRVL